MLARVRSRFNYANVVATLAVLFSAGAGGYAIGAVPNSDGTIAACYVAKGDGKGSLRLLVSGSKCARGERKVRWNKLGRQGLPGPQGVQGIQGIQGPVGPSEAANQGLFPGNVPGLTLAAGSYVAQATVQLQHDGEGGAEDVTCTLTIGSAQHSHTVTLQPGEKQPLALHQIHELRAPGNANVSCNTTAFWNGLIIATRVGAVREI